MVSEDGGPRSRTGGVSVSLSSPDGHVVGGGVAMLTAASPVQVFSLPLWIYLSSLDKIKRTQALQEIVWGNESWELYDAWHQLLCLYCSFYGGVMLNLQFFLPMILLSCSMACQFYPTCSPP